MYKYKENEEEIDNIEELDGDFSINMPHASKNNKRENSESYEQMDKIST